MFEFIQISENCGSLIESQQSIKPCRKQHFQLFSGVNKNLANSAIASQLELRVCVHF